MNNQFDAQFIPSSFTSQKSGMCIATTDAQSLAFFPTLMKYSIL